MDSPDLVVDALGVAVGIPATGAAKERLRAQWSRALTDRPPQTVAELTRVTPAGDDEALDYAISVAVTLAALKATAGKRLNLHAGTVADRDGRALTLVGRSGSGKTTAISTIARHLGYLSDETTSLDEDLRIAAHAKPLSVITDRDRPGEKASLSPDALGLLPAPSDATLRRLVLLDRTGEEVGLVPTDPAFAIATLVSQSSSLAVFDAPILRLAELIDACGGAWTLRYGEFTTWVDDLVALLDADPRPAPERLHHPGPVGPAADPAEPSLGAPEGEAAPDEPGTPWSRIPWRDAVEYEDALVVMVASRVDVVTGLGVLVWLALEEPQTSAHIVEIVVSAWGPHPEAAALVDSALETLREAGLVRGPART